MKRLVKGKSARQQVTHSSASAARIALKSFALAALVAASVLPVPATASPAKAAKTDQITLDSKVTILLGSDEPLPIAQAAEDLANDFEKVLGSKPKIVNRAEDAAPVTILIAYKSKLGEGLRPASLTEPESFSISVANARWKTPSHTRIVLLAGADIRGTTYAVYQFSQDYLGTDPMYYWTDHEPAHRDRIPIPIPLKKDFRAPLFHYRGFFINDEDLLTGWAPGEKKDGTGISLEVWNKIYETILRLKGNIVAPGTWIFPDEPQVKLAGKRGLIITQHHAIPLGLNVARWPENVPYSYSAHPEILQRAWKDAVAEYAPDQEVLWTVGLRGLSDASYAAFDPSVRGNDKALGELVTRAISDQMNIVRSLHPDAKFITSLWQEGARLVQQGYLKIPPEVGIVWADTGYGYLQDKGEVEKGQGAYYHVAMMNNRANQLTEMVPMERVASELGRYIKVGATNYLLINTSDIRPVSMMTRAVMDVGWKGLPPGESEQFYQQWSAQEFGEKAAAPVAAVYKEYFAAPAHFPGSEPTLEYGDNFYHTEARRMLLTYMIGSPLFGLPGQAPKWQIPRVITGVRGENAPPPLADAIQAEIQRCGEAQPRWDAAWKKAIDAEALVAPERQPFYHAHVLAMIAINRESNRILSLVAQAIEQASSGETAQARETAEQAIRSLDEIKKAEAAAEYGKWTNWYRGDWLTGIDRTHEIIQSFLHYLDDPLSPMPPPLFWTGWEAYYHIMHYEGDRSSDVK
jgi:Glycosyl hydrolase family 115